MYRRFLFGSRGEQVAEATSAGENYFKTSLKKICDEQMDLLPPTP